MSSSDNAIIAARELTHALLNPAPAAPFATIGDAQSSALKQLADFCQNATTTLPSSPPQLPLHRPSPSPRVPDQHVTPASPLPRVQSYSPHHRYPTQASVHANQVTAIDPIQCFPTQHLANSVIDQITGQSYEYRHLVTSKVTGHTTEVWIRSCANELGRLANGVGTRIPICKRNYVNVT